jgi:cyclic pyranopterin phosphate synthase
MTSEPSWTHLDAENNPAMVDISAKPVTIRTAVACAEMLLPPEVLAQLHDGDIRSPKGPVFQTAVIAGTMAAKQTSALIPFCHPVPLDAVRITVAPPEDGILRIEAEVKTVHKTGVEMEALTAASVAALTVYDMCKAFSPAMEIRRVRLLGKRGGKMDYTAGR